ncbi:PIN domain-containing protein [Deinococcus sp.]|uniref:PIN domain-containing protein n=1 Tax=Deinococcus sp. TaxID=47478 RepID=UPI003C7E5D47
MNPQVMNPGGYTLDASVLLSYLRQENGGEALLDYVASGVPLLVSPANLVEVYGVLIGRGEFTQAEVEGGLGLLSHLFEVVPLDSAHVAAAGALLGRSKAQRLNLALGDCLCLSVAAGSGTVALTADRAWQTLAELPAPVELIREG